MSPCTCPSRVPSPPPPMSRPFPATKESRDHLETWLLNHYNTNTFKVSEHQPLSKISGPPMRLMLTLMTMISPITPQFQPLSTGRTMSKLVLIKMCAKVSLSLPQSPPPSLGAT
ncbi:hypothetical protein PoB_000270000 [Plakobranchus ocellatus]|uniref:Uncharacterized protein n=1 Tax=Plakobranchus ocellatus TaxID=259542 RepID=A0AAV3Y0H9_9GAST|nr:hypothetical protein PoB_000270000 [Plakobranchus ocellatus]